MNKILLPAMFLCAIFVLLLINLEKTSQPKLVRSTMQPHKQDTYTPAPPSLRTIFNADHTWIATLSAARIRTVLVTGDIIPARTVNNTVVSKNNYLWPYEKVITPLENMHPDITFVNLETPLLHDCQTTVTGMSFCGSDKNIAGLNAIHVTVASLANNHAGNYNVNGVTETITHLAQNNIAVTGINGAYIKNIRGVRFAFLSYNDISAPQPGIENASETLIKTDIADAKKHADVVIVMFHWGVEYREQPDERQKYLAHFTIDNGADLVLSNHPHWIQPVEIYKNKYIMYAHGNFIFDQMWSEETKKGALGLYTFYDDTLIDAQYFPLYIENYGQAHFVDGKDKEAILKHLEEQSYILQTSYVTK